jgi:hypothetical protein
MAAKRGNGMSRISFQVDFKIFLKKCFRFVEPDSPITRAVDDMKTGWNKEIRMGLFL